MSPTYPLINMSKETTCWLSKGGEGNVRSKFIKTPYFGLNKG